MLDVKQIISEYRSLPNYKRELLPQWADEMGISVNTLDNMLNPNHHYNLPVTKLIQFIKATESYTLLDHIEARLGRIALKVKASSIVKLDMAGIACFLKEAGEAMTAVGNAVSEGRTTRAGAAECRREIMDLMQVCMGILKTLDEIEGG